jgi:hypothetical protein
MKRKFSSWRFVLVTAAAFVVGAIIPAQPSVGHRAPTSQKEFMETIAQSPISKWLSSGGQTALRLGLQTPPQETLSVPEGTPTALRTSSVPGVEAPAAGVGNVRVNNPAGDAVAEEDMTTQSETSVAVHGKNVVIGYNDDGKSAFFLSPALDFTGYSWSSDGGATFHDSVLPNALPALNLGDPVVAADRAGNFYFASLASAPIVSPVVVGRSTDGGKTFSQPIQVSSDEPFDFTDKPWMTVGPDPSDQSKDNVYVSWTDFFADCGGGNCVFGTRIQLAVSRNQGKSFSRPVTVVEQPDRVDKTEFAFVSGSTIGVDPKTGVVYLGWERFSNPFSDRKFDYPNRTIYVARSDDGGRSFRDPTKAGRPVPIGKPNVVCGNVLGFGAGKVARVQEFPSLAVAPTGKVFVTFNTDVQGRSQVFVARSSDRAQSWSRSPVNPKEFTDQFMPSATADANGVHVLYYQRASATRLAPVLSSSSNGSTWGAAAQVSTRTFEAPFTLPNFDPAIALCYMGDYVSVVSDGNTLHAAWGDNRDIVKDGLFPNGRVDPDVFYAKIAS